jgi:hypothetical protein
MSLAFLMQFSGSLGLYVLSRIHPLLSRVLIFFQVEVVLYYHFSTLATQG